MEMLQMIMEAGNRAFSLVDKKARPLPITSMKYFEEAFAKSTRPLHRKPNPSGTADDFITHLYLPLFRQAAKSFNTFSSSHVMFYEKFLLLSAVILQSTSTK